MSRILQHHAGAYRAFSSSNGPGCAVAAVTAVKAENEADAICPEAAP